MKKVTRILLEEGIVMYGMMKKTSHHLETMGNPFGISIRRT